MPWYMYLLMILWAVTILLAILGIRRRRKTAQLQQQLAVNKEQLQEVRGNIARLQKELEGGKASALKLTQTLNNLVALTKEHGLDYLKTADGHKLLQRLKDVCQECQGAGENVDYEALLGVLYLAQNS